MAYKFTDEFFEKAMTYCEYVSMTERLVSEGKTTGPDQSEKMAEYTKLNLQRMRRTEKTTGIMPELKETLSGLKGKQNWILITESWCGDAANIVPVIGKIAGESDKIRLGLILRDENPEVMNEYLTNGGKAIPMLIMLDENFRELGTWGPRPTALQDKVKEEKAKPGYSLEELKKMLQMWYFNDKSESTQKEIAAALKNSF